MANTWRYQIIYHDEAEPPYYGLHEVYLWRRRWMYMWTETPCIRADTLMELWDCVGKDDDEDADLRRRDVARWPPISESHLERIQRRLPLLLLNWWWNVEMWWYRHVNKRAGMEKL